MPRAGQAAVAGPGGAAAVPGLGSVGSALARQAGAAGAGLSPEHHRPGLPGTPIAAAGAAERERQIQRQWENNKLK